MELPSPGEEPTRKIGDDETDKSVGQAGRLLALLCRRGGIPLYSECSWLTASLFLHRQTAN